MNNRIAILARPRSGSTSLFRMIESQIKNDGFECFGEPYNPNNYSSYYKEGINFDTLEPVLKYDKLFIKTLFGCRQYPIKSVGNDENQFNNWMSTFFNKVIVLDRRDKRLQAESLLANLISGKKWDVPKIYEIDKIEKERIEDEIKNFTYFSNRLRLLAERENWPMFYYEDLFIDHNFAEIERMFNYLELKIDDDKIQDFIISDKRKVRIDPN
jgi:hypothetical protein